MAVCDFIAAQKDTEDQNSDGDERQTNKRTLSPTKAADYFSAAAPRRRSRSQELACGNAGTPRSSQIYNNTARVRVRANFG